MVAATVYETLCQEFTQAVVQAWAEARQQDKASASEKWPWVENRFRVLRQRLRQ